MDNFDSILGISEDQAPYSVFVNGQDEGGFSISFDPTTQKEIFSVFIHNTLPFVQKAYWEFNSFQDARLFAAERFQNDWEVLIWDGEIHRKCGSGEYGDSEASCSSGSCGSGGCGTSSGAEVSSSSGCGSGCSSCSATKPVFDF